MKQYLDLMQHVKTNGIKKTDRTGTGTLSVFGYQMRFDLAQGFPVVTTKKLHLRSIIHELLWFLKGDTNVKYLHDNKPSGMNGRMKTAILAQSMVTSGVPGRHPMVSISTRSPRLSSRSKILPIHGGSSSAPGTWANWIRWHYRPATRFSSFMLPITNYPASCISAARIFFLAFPLTSRLMLC
jgi:hypothetical protein